MKSKVKYDLTRLDKFVKSFDKKHAVQVGIFGKKNARNEGGQTNAAIGAKHEFGSVSDNTPARSFLRMPLSMEGEQIVKDSSKGSVKLMAEGKILVFFKNIGIACEGAVQRAFDTRGFGNWKENAPQTIWRKKSDAPLIDTGQLRRSIASKVVEI